MKGNFLILHVKNAIKIFKCYKIMKYCVINCSIVMT